jgi:hypothetical protein
MEIGTKKMLGSLDYFFIQISWQCCVSRPF